MTLIAGRMPMPGFHILERNSYAEDSAMQGILKSGPTRKVNKNITSLKQLENNQRNEESKRLVRFCESEENDKQHPSDIESEGADTQEPFMFGSNIYYVNHSNPNSAVRKLFPNSKLTPINPINRSNLKDTSTTQGRFNLPNTYEINHNILNKTKPKYNNEYVRNRNNTKKRIEETVIKRNFIKNTPNTKLRPGKYESTTPLIERIKQLTCDDDTNGFKDKEESCDRNTINVILKRFNPPNCILNSNSQIKDLPKQTKEGLNLMRYNQNILQASLQPSGDKYSRINKSSGTDEARRSFLFSLSQENVANSGDRISLSTNSSNADTVYSLSDIEEALTEEEKEIKEAFAHENKQDELELFVQQDAGRTERLRKRYSSTPKPENFTNKPPTFFTNKSCSSSNLTTSIPHLVNQNCTKNDKPKFGSTIEILQQLQQQIETPYQMEGRRTACSNYSDSSIPLSERLFCNDSSDSYEAILPKVNIHRTYSLDSKNYEEIDHCQSAFSVPRTKSYDPQHITYLDPDYYCPQYNVQYCGNFAARNGSLEFENIGYASPPNLYANQQITVPDRVVSYCHPANTRPLHPVLQRQYCKYPIHQVPPKPAESGKILTPPNRMHTYMNIPTNASCFPTSPFCSKINSYTCPTGHSNEPHYDARYSHSNIYQNIPFPINPHLMAIQRLCTDSERGIPEGASALHDSKELYPTIQRGFHYPANIATIPKPTSLPQQYCVDV